MGTPVDLDALTKATRRREFEDGLMDYTIGCIFLVYCLLAWFFFSTPGLNWYAMAVINYPLLIKAGLFLLCVLLIAGPLFLRKLIDHITIFLIWKDSGLVKPLQRQTSWPVTFLSVAVALGMILYASWLMVVGSIGTEGILRTLVSSSGIATGILYIGICFSLDIRRYLIIGLIGGVISVLILFFPIPFSIAWLIFGITWALLLAISGTLALRHVLSLNRESPSE